MRAYIIIGVLQNVNYNVCSQGCGTISEKAYSLYAHEIGEKWASSLLKYLHTKSAESMLNPSSSVEPGIRGKHVVSEYCKIYDAP